MTEPFRTAGVPFAAIDTVTVPGPVPVPPFATVSQDALLVALHVHDPAVVTATVAVLAGAAALWVTGEML